MKSNYKMTNIKLRVPFIHLVRNHCANANDSVAITTDVPSSMTLIMCIQVSTSNPFRLHLTTVHRLRCPPVPTTTKPIAIFCQCKKRKRSRIGWPQKSLCTRKKNAILCPPFRALVRKKSYFVFFCCSF